MTIDHSLKPVICIVLAGAAATLVQALHWQKVFTQPAQKRKRFLQTANFIISGVFIFGSAILGFVPHGIENDTLAYAFAATIGFAPFKTIKTLTRSSPSLGPESAFNSQPASIREFIHL